MSEAVEQSRKMKFKIFTWQENPELLRIQAVRTPEYTVDENGKYDYTGLGPMCRIVTGSGVFRGEFAYENFNALQVLLANGTAGELVHPVWGTMSAFLIGLEMENEGREDFVAYSFTFREADESGCIPALPDNWKDQS